MSEASKKFQRENAHQFYLGNPPVAGHAELVADPEYQKLAVDEKAMETKYAELLKAFVGKTDPQLTMDERNVVGNINHLCEMERKALRTKLYNLKVDYGIDPDTQKRAPDTGTLLSPSTTGIFLDSVDLKILRALAVDPRRTMTQTQLEQYELEKNDSMPRRKTISDRLTKLRAAELTHRPNGINKGEAITPAGLERINGERQ